VIAPVDVVSVLVGCATGSAAAMIVSLAIALISSGGWSW
jgi:hypothetical protein